MGNDVQEVVKYVMENGNSQRVLKRLLDDGSITYVMYLGADAILKAYERNEDALLQSKEN